MGSVLAQEQREIFIGSFASVCHAYHRGEHEGKHWVAEDLNARVLEVKFASYYSNRRKNAKSAAAMIAAKGAS